MTHTIVTEETELLEKVSVVLQENPYILPPSEMQIVDELQLLQRDLAQAKSEDKGALLHQYDRQFSLLQQIRLSRGQPVVDPDSPYFAHLRLREGDKERSVLLGKATRIEAGVRIVDWRNAPISRIFYQYQQDDEYEEYMGGRDVAGTVIARRTVSIRNGVLHRIDAPEGSFIQNEGDWNLSPKTPAKLAGGEGYTLRAYGHNDTPNRTLGTDTSGRTQRLDKRLPDIAGLIDPDQFALIAQPLSGIVVVRGTAGSGKTTVALHRIAYLAYQDPKLNSPQTIFVVFSRTLRDYIAHIFPSLNIQNAQVVSYPEWAKKQRIHHFPKLPKTTRDTCPAIVARIKNHPAMLQALAWQAEMVSGPATAEQAIDDWASVLTQPTMIERALSENQPHGFSSKAIQDACDWNRDRHEELLAWLDGEKEVDVALDGEDDSLLLRAWQCRVGPLRSRSHRPLRYHHMAIDEIQDFSPLDVQVLLDCLDEQKSCTLAGDTQQHVMANAGFDSWSQFIEHLGIEVTKINTLRVSYRSTKAIVDFSLALLGDLREDDEAPLVTRDGPEVEFFRFTDHGGAVAFLSKALESLMLSEPLASVALLTRNEETSDTYYQGLKRTNVPRLRRVVDQSFTFAPGIEVTEIQQSKGLEFDYVILLETSAALYPDTPLSRRILHVGATRAIHQLWVTSVASPSPILRDCLNSK